MVSKNSLRKKGREYAFQFLYQLDLLNPSNQDHSTIDELLDNFEQSYLEPDSENPNNQLHLVSKTFAAELINGLIKEHDSIVQILENSLHKQNLNKLNKIDITLLKLGCYEIIFKQNTPAKAIINETIDMAKIYGNQESYSIINGVLDNVWKSNSSSEK